MKRLGAFIAGLLLLVLSANAQSPVSVIGPITVGNCAQFSSTTIIKDAGVVCSGGGGGGGIVIGTTTVTGAGAGQFLFNNSGVVGAATLGTMSTQNANAVAITGGTITGMPTPIVSVDVATKGYVDAVAIGLTIHTQVSWATTTVLPNTPTYSNGSSGVGATLTAGGNAAIVVDSGNPVLNDRVLVKNQASALQNGVYTVTTVGSGSVPWVLTRATDFNTTTAGNMAAGAYFFVTEGTVNTAAAWVFTTTGAITIGTTSLTFSLFSGSGGGSPGGSNGQVQYNNSGTFGGLTNTQLTALIQPFSPSLPGAVPASGGGTASFLRADGTWADPSCTPVAGAVGDGSTDNAAALNAALAALPANGGCLYFPRGKYKFNSQISYSISGGATPFHLRIAGDGPDATTLYWPGSHGLVITYNSDTHSVSLANMAITTGNGGTYTGLQLVSSTCLTGGLIVPTYIQNVSFRGDDFGTSDYWAEDAIIAGVSGTNWESDAFIGGPGPTGEGIRFIGNPGTCGSSAGYSIWHNLSKLGFLHFSVGIEYGDYVQGVNLSQSNFESVNIGVYVPSGAVGQIAQLAVLTSSFDTVGDAVQVNSALPGVTVMGNNMAILASHVAVNITSAGSTFDSVIGNSIQGPASSAGIVFAGDDSIASGNVLFGLGVGINIGAGGIHNRATGNSYKSNSTNVSALGTQIFDSGGYVAFTPTIFAVTGTLTTASATGRYRLQQDGTTMCIQIVGTITNNGSGSNAIGIGNIPFSTPGGVITMLPGTENGVTGKMLEYVISGTSAVVFNYDHSYPGVNGASLIVNGCYEVVTGL